VYAAAIAARKARKPTWSLQKRSIDSGPGMITASALRILLLLAAGGLAACAGPSTAPTPQSLGQTSLLLISRSSQTLALMSQGTAAPAAPTGNAMVSKTVSPDGMAALLATFESEGLFAHAVDAAPRSARQALVLDRDGRRSTWLFSGSPSDARYVAFVKARNYFLQLFNHAQNYVPADQGVREEIKDSGDRASELRRRRS